MSIGGIDIIIPVPPGVSPAESVLSQVRLFWPCALFVDAEATVSHPIDGPWVLAQGGRSVEFLVYRDSDALDSWHLEGLTPTNANTMLHFLIDDLEDMSRELTLVCDSRTEAIEQLVRDLGGRLSGGRPRHGPSRHPRP